MNELLLQLGAGGIFVYVVLKMLLSFLKEKRHTESTSATHAALVATKLETIHTLLDARDTDGAPLIYVPRSLADAIAALAEATSEQNRLLERLNTNIREARKDIEELKHDRL